MSSYNPDIKYRCDIIRGKALKEMDDLLPLYADITHSLAPLEAVAFTEQFDEMLAQKLKVAKKTISNQRSEMGRLFALYFEQDGQVPPVSREDCLVFLSSRHESLECSNV